jgi:hypothetical protein
MMAQIADLVQKAREVALIENNHIGLGLQNPQATQ